MVHAAFRWTVFLTGLLLLGPLAGAMTAGLSTADGSHHASVLVTTSPVMGLIAAVVAFALSGAIGVVAGRLFGARAGFFATGLVLAWAAWGTGRIDDLLRAGGAGSSSTMYLLAVEGVIIGALAVLVGIVIVKFARTEAPAAAVPAAAAQPILASAGNAHPPHTRWYAEPRLIWDASAPMPLGATIVVGGIIAWLVAQDSLKGQAFGAAALAGFFGATAGRLASQKVSPVVFLAGIGVLAALGPVVTTFLHSGAGLVRASQAGTIFPLARILPLDWCAGAFVGIPLGLSWAHSLIERHPQEG